MAAEPITPGPGTPVRAAPDPAALRRRTLLAAVISFPLFLVVAFAIATAGLPDWFLLIGVAAVYAVVIRPLMKPVRDASRLRRSLAYQAFLDGKDGQG